jgi:hypothetical protein
MPPSKGLILLNRAERVHDIKRKKVPNKGNKGNLAVIVYGEKMTTATTEKAVPGNE